jgi:hypothetical protein
MSKNELAGPADAGAKIANGLYTITIEMHDGKRGFASGVLVLQGGRIMGGDSYFYYTGSYSYRNGKWRGELITYQHHDAIGKNLAFGGGREVACGFTGVYAGNAAEVEGTALVGKTSVAFSAKMVLKQPV